MPFLIGSEARERFGRRRSAGYAGGAALAALALWIYWPSLRGGWLWDDPLEVTGNAALRSVAGLRAIWSGSAGTDYWPLTGTIRWVQWHLWGSDQLGYHATNVAFHVLGAALLWRLVAGLGGADGFRTGFIAGLLFLVHPVAVESVAWVSELKNVLSLPCMLLAALAYLEWDRGGGARAWTAALAWFVAALLCKSSVVMLPGCLLLFAWWRRGAVRGRDVISTLPFFAAGILAGVVTIWLQWHRAINGPGAVRYSSSWAGAAWALGFYFQKCIWPAHLAPVYAANVPGRFPSAGKAPLLRTAGFGLGCFVLNLAPVLGLVPMSLRKYSPVADHLAYVSLACFAGLAAAAIALIPRRIGNVLAAALVLVLAVQSRGYSRIFRGAVAFWTYAAQACPGAAVAHYNLGTELARAGRFSDALPELETATRLRPGYFEAETNLGGLLILARRPREAVPHFQEALRANPASAEAHNGLGIALRRLGRIEDAIGQFEAALRLKPDFAAARGNLASACEAAGRYDEARRIQAAH